MKAGHVVIIVLVILAALGAVGYSIYRGDQESARNKAVIDSLFQSKEKLLFNDSIRSSIERKIIDSVNQSLAKRDLRIRRLEIDLNKTRKQNEELQKLFDRVPVNMPSY